MSQSEILSQQEYSHYSDDVIKDLALEPIVQGKGFVPPEKQALMIGEDINDEFLDEYHPANDEYSKQMTRLVAGLENLSRYMSFEERVMAKHLSSGVSLSRIKDVAPELDPKSIKITQNITRAVGLVNAIQLLKQGVSKQQKGFMLWRIAVKNEIKRPDVTIAAINSMNKMSGDIDAPKDTGGITLIVANNALINAPLDQGRK